MSESDLWRVREMGDGTFLADFRTGPGVENWSPARSKDSRLMFALLPDAEEAAQRGAKQHRARCIAATTVRVVSSGGLDG